jgi:hypothetical protein
MPQLAKALSGSLRVLIAIDLAISACLWIDNFSAFAQTSGERMAVSEEKITEHDRRISDLESMKLSERLAKLETNVHDLQEMAHNGNYLQYTTNGGLVLLLVDVFVRRRKSTQKSD